MAIEVATGIRHLAVVSFKLTDEQDVVFVSIIDYVYVDAIMVGIVIMLRNRRHAFATNCNGYGIGTPFFKIFKSIQN